MWGTYGDFKFVAYDDYTARITEYVGSDTQIIIPNDLDGYTVTGIGDRAFYYYTNLTNVTIPDSVTSIGDDVFYNCANLTSIKLPKSIKKLGVHFRNSSNTKIIFEGTASEWASISFGKIQYDDFVSGESNGDNLYINNELPSVITLENVGSISDYAFTGAKELTEVVADLELKSIGTESFANCPKLEKITIPSNVSLSYDYLISRGNINSFYAKNISEINIVDGSTELSEDFCNLVKTSSINSLKIPSSLTYIPDSAFKNCLQLETITLPKEVTRIEYNAFSGCTNLTIKGYKNSYAETYANLTGIPFEEIPERDTTIPTQPTEPAQQTCDEVGHHTKIVGKKAATYFAAGYTGDKVCTVCGKVITKGKAIAKLKLAMPKVKITAGKQKLTVKYTKVKDATGFQVKYIYKGKTTTKTYTSKKSVTKTIKKLKKGTYKVSVRALIKSKGKTAYSNWTTAKKVKIK